MPLFQLPFHVDSVAGNVVIGFSVGIVFTVFTVLGDRKVWPFRPIAELFVAIRMEAIDEPKRFALFKKVMYSLAGLFFLIGLFYGLVLVGVIGNGNPPLAPTIEEFNRMQQGARK